MRTYIFADKNSSITLTVSAENEKQAITKIEDFMDRSDFNSLRLQEVVIEEKDSIAYDEGFDEKSFGDSDVKNCPYSLGADEWNDWMDGFNNGWI